MCYINLRLTYLLSFDVPTKEGLLQVLQNTTSTIYQRTSVDYVLRPHWLRVGLVHRLRSTTSSL